MGTVPGEPVPAAAARPSPAAAPAFFMRAFRACSFELQSPETPLLGGTVPSSMVLLLLLAAAPVAAAVPVVAAAARKALAAA